MKKHNELEELDDLPDEEPERPRSPVFLVWTICCGLVFLSLVVGVAVILVIDPGRSPAPNPRFTPLAPVPSHTITWPTIATPPGTPRSTVTRPQESKLFVPTAPLPTMPVSTKPAPTIPKHQPPPTDPLLPP
jgi:hypothetical protein